MINFDEIEQLEQDVQQQTELLKINTEGLANDLQQFKDITEALGLIEAENAELQKRLDESETNYAELKKQVSKLEEVIQKRDNIMKVILKNVSELNNSVTQIRNSLTGSST